MGWEVSGILGFIVANTGFGRAIGNFKILNRLMIGTLLYSRVLCSAMNVVTLVTLVIGDLCGNSCDSLFNRADA